MIFCRKINQLNEFFNPFHGVEVDGFFAPAMYPAILVEPLTPDDEIDHLVQADQGEAGAQAKHATDIGLDGIFHIILAKRCQNLHIYHSAQVGDFSIPN